MTNTAFASGGFSIARILLQSMGLEDTMKSDGSQRWMTGQVFRARPLHFVLSVRVNTHTKVSQAM